MMPKEELLSRLSALHTSGEPLNLTEAKRSHPALVRAAFAQTPFLGWKRALQEAGIDYSQIVVRLTDHVICEICGKDMLNLPNHLRFKHEWTLRDYKEAYPDAEIWPDTLIAAKNRFDDPALLPHWEPLWTHEYALDRMRAWSDAGYPMSYADMTRQDLALTMYLSKHRDDLGSYDEVLAKVGLDAKTIRLHIDSEYTNPDEVVAGIRDRQQQGLRLNGSAVRKDGRRGRPLIQAARKWFGSWDEALRAASIDPADVRLGPPVVYTHADSVIEAIRNLRQQGLSLNYGSVFHDLKTGRTLIKKARKWFGSWDGALRAAGIDPADVRLRKARRSPGEATDALGAAAKTP